MTFKQSILFGLLFLTSQALSEVEPIQVSDLQSPQSNMIPKGDCETMLEFFSEAISDYANCTTRFARPIQLCMRCRDKYLQIEKMYVDMKMFIQDNVTCNVILTKQDRLNIVGFHYENNMGEKSIWNQAHCPNCYEGNDDRKEQSKVYKKFKVLWDDTMKCFEHYYEFNPHLINLDSLGPQKPDLHWPWLLHPELESLGRKIRNDNGSLCYNCSEVYNIMRGYFWEHVVPTNNNNKLKDVCYDIRDAFNLTGIIWKETFNCEPQPQQNITVIPIVVITVLMIVMLYTLEPLILPYFFPNWIKKRVYIAQADVFDHVLDDDENCEVDGSFEVVKGLTAEEYIKRFVTVEIPNTENPEERNIWIRVPPDPQEFYDIEIDSMDSIRWKVPSKEYFREYSILQGQWRNGELSRKAMDILSCKLIMKEIKRSGENIRPGSRNSNSSSNVLDRFLSTDSSAESIASNSTFENMPPLEEDQDDEKKEPIA